MSCPDMFDTKVCKRCGEERLLRSFAKAKTMRDGHEAICKRCKTNMTLEKRDKEKLKQQNDFFIRRLDVKPSEY